MLTVYELFLELIALFFRLQHNFHKHNKNMYSIPNYVYYYAIRKLEVEDKLL